MKLTKILFSSLVSLAVLCTGALAGQIINLGAKPIYFDTQFVDTEARCTHRFEGAFEKGDATKIIRAKPSLLCLNSLGGSFVEALKVTSFMKENPVATKIENGARCESACALVFMAGSFHAHESDVAMAWRVLHPRGLLGFHAPALVVSEGAYDKSTVERAYQLAMKSVSKLVIDLVHRPDSGGAAMKPSLLGQMLETPSRSMLYVETVDQAGRWDISISSLEPEFKPSKRQLAVACSNIFFWVDDVSAISEHNNVSEFWMDSDENHGLHLKGTITMNEMSGAGCEFSVHDQFTTAQVSSDTGKNHVVITPHMLVNARTRLTDLPVDRSDKGGDGQCIVIANGTESRRESCVLSIVTDGAQSTRTYIWASGQQMIIKLDGAKASFDGVRTSKPFEFDGKDCIINPSKGDIFCFSAG